MASQDIVELQRSLQAMELKLTEAESISGAKDLELEGARSEIHRLIKSAEKSQNDRQTAQSETARPIILTSSRKLERFRDRPDKGSSDMTADEWICEIKSHLATCKLPVDEQAAFIIEHLTGKARREIIGRGSMVARDPEKIFSVLISVFGDGASLPTLQERFFSYHQGDTEDIVSLSLEFVDLYDRIARLDPTFLPSRESTLKGRLASAVRDENLRRELRRLNDESPELSFFELRDR